MEWGDGLLLLGTAGSGCTIKHIDTPILFPTPLLWKKYPLLHCLST